MPKIHMHEVIDHFDSEMQGALQSACDQVIDDDNFDFYDLYSTFKRSFAQRVNAWEDVPERFVRP
jgi:hypothetical protein